MRRSGWALSLLLLGVTAVTIAMSGDALAGDKKGKKDKKDKKDKKSKEKVIDVRERGSRKGEIVDPTKPKKDAGKKGSGVKGRGSKGNSSKSQARSRSRKQSRKNSRKRSSGGKK